MKKSNNFIIWCKCTSFQKWEHSPCTFSLILLLKSENKLYVGSRDHIKSTVWRSDWLSITYLISDKYIILHKYWLQDVVGETKDLPTETDISLQKLVSSDSEILSFLWLSWFIFWRLCELIPSFIFLFIFNGKCSMVSCLHKNCDCYKFGIF